MALILASASPIRKAMLEAAGVEFLAVPADVDESALKDGATLPGALALQLAEAKALEVSRRRPDDWVIGSDSVVSVGARRFDKPADRDEAADHLRFFSGKAMTLTSAVALARSCAIDWSYGGNAELNVRLLSDDFIRDYLDAEWPEVSYCVGVFRLEGRGVQLFESIYGDHFTILGMPLLPLLGALRERGLIAA